MGVSENGYNYKLEDTEWYKNKGCEEVKICAGKGDFIREYCVSYGSADRSLTSYFLREVWDSRTIHWNASPMGDQTRFVTYVCYCPRSLMSPAELAKKVEVFKGRKGTTHFPVSFIPVISGSAASVTRLDGDELTLACLLQYLNRIPAERPGYHNALPRRPDGTLDAANRTRPRKEPDETPTVLNAVGIRA